MSLTLLAGCQGAPDSIAATSQAMMAPGSAADCSVPLPFPALEWSDDLWGGVYGTIVWLAQDPSQTLFSIYGVDSVDQKVIFYTQNASMDAVTAAQSWPHSNGCAHQPKTALAPPANPPPDPPVPRLWPQGCAGTEVFSGALSWCLWGCFPWSGSGGCSQQQLVSISAGDLTAIANGVGSSGGGSSGGGSSGGGYGGGGSGTGTGSGGGHHPMLQE
jgi:hypothetical protein